MEYKKTGNRILVRLDKGEELLDQIKSVCEREDVTLGTVSGLGACSDITFGLFETAAKKYHSLHLTGNHELVGLTGNITTMNGEVYLHVHAMFADAAYNVKGGHLNRAVISATGELVIEVLEGRAGRKFSDAIGLNLLAFDGRPDDGQ